MLNSILRAIFPSRGNTKNNDDTSSRVIPSEEPVMTDTSRKRSLFSQKNDSSRTVDIKNHKRRRIFNDTSLECCPLSDTQFEIMEGEGSTNIDDEIDIEGFDLSPLLKNIPAEILENICSYVTLAKEHYSLQLTCRRFHQIANTQQYLSLVNLTGETNFSKGGSLVSVSRTINVATDDFRNNDGKGSILYGVELPEIAIEKLYKYAAAGNLQALYMIGMVVAYCHGDNLGVTILQQTADMGYLHAAYTLGLILRDSDKTKSDYYLQMGVDRTYLPSCQELLSSQEVKDKFGDLSYISLKSYFDPIALNRLLGKTYIHSSGVRSVSTSHCWNPNCGKWALKATQSHSRAPQLAFSSRYLPPLQSHLEGSLLKLLEMHTRKSDNFKLGVNECASLVPDLSCDNKSRTDITNQFILPSVSGVPRCMDERSFRVSRMKMCSSCRRAKYCSKLCQVYDWRSGRHKMECQYL